MGDLDLYSPCTRSLEAALSQHTTGPDGPAEIVVDLSGCTFCDSTGLNVLLQARADAITRGRFIRLASPNPQFVRFLRRTGTIDLFTITPTPPVA
ncbi:STAS domain-containing protein [Streptomyces sp. NPDC058290]|uniref:STAS domain-containing protein n=1 Tax=unclassified Streptomyces TaxID=2593676 RepID=UPI0036EFB5F1